MSFLFLPACIFFVSTLAEPSATILYPNAKSTPTINIGTDTLDIAYTSKWKSVKLEAFCKHTPSDGQYSFVTLPDGPFTTNGTAIWRYAGVGFEDDIAQYPTKCYLSILNYYNQTQSVSAGHFSMASSSGTAKIFSQTAASTGSYSLTTAGQTITDTQLPASQTSASSAATSTAISGLSTGAIAGIAVGASICGLLIIAGLLFLFIRVRSRKIATANSQHHVGLDEKIQQNATGGRRQPFRKAEVHEMPAETEAAELPTDSQPLNEADSKPVVEIAGRPIQSMNGR